MYVTTQDYWVIPGEPHLGKITESEEIWEPYEAEDLIIEQIMEGYWPKDGIFYAIDTLNEYDVPVDAQDVLDWDLLSDFMDTIESVDDINIDDLYAAAGVTKPQNRRK